MRLRRLTRLDACLARHLKTAGVTVPLLDDTARQEFCQATKGIPRTVNKLAMTALRLAAERSAPLGTESILLDATAEVTELAPAKSAARAPRLFMGWGALLLGYYPVFLEELRSGGLGHFNATAARGALPALLRQMAFNPKS